MYHDQTYYFTFNTSIKCDTSFPYNFVKLIQFTCYYCDQGQISRSQQGLIKYSRHQPICHDQTDFFTFLPLELDVMPAL